MFMKFKVEICGIDTSKLKTMSEKEKLKLFKLVKQGNVQARDELINGNLKLVLSVIQKFSNRFESVDDLFQIGCIGLIKSIDHFNTDFNVRFSTYAVPMIIGEIRKHLRDSNSIKSSRAMKDIAYKSIKIRDKLTIENNKEPTIEEIAKKLDIPSENIILALESITDPISLNEPVFCDNNSSDQVYVLDQLGDKNTDLNWIDEISLKQSVKNLNKREKRILFSRYLEGKTQTQVASEIGISQAQVSRLEKIAMQKVKNKP
ncbi:MAG: RNA polymerase sporulation sigma factor SigG [Candidatus Paraimprobicoccus trichonymphae]|uniref:RNA polymerase sigma factor n=1 Tax=Candidatus Paraimprobicoccus trichonymphae TaxID=3033793 RepID=A0AA48IHE4_9FIRM|nr:MAG: RNA polymerase sporulation sigma factor SigG [Candidatus Paraimprobicoccus trichonymphae]